MVGSFKQEDIERVPMRPNQGFEPLVSVVFYSLESFCFLIPSTKSVEASVQDLSTVKESQLPVPEDRAAREARHLLMAQKKEEKDAAKKRQVKKTLEREALKKHHCQQSLEGLLIEESPFEMVSGEDEDSSDDDAGSRYDTMTFLAHLPDVRPLLEPIGGSTSQASREVSAPIEGEGEPVEGRARAGPSERGATSPRVSWGRSVAPLPQARSPRTLSAGGVTASVSEARAPSMGIRT
jgi:hypothetical protein